MILLLSLGPACFPAPESYGVGVDGKPIRDLGGPGIHLVVLIFAASDCPISNRYVPEVARLHREFAAQGVRFWWVFPNPQDTASVVAQHNREFAISESVLLDTQQAVVRKAHATITPESAVFAIQNGSMREVYHGRIDDRYLAFGRERPAPQHHELEAAVIAALAGKPVAPPAGPSVGCAIVPLQR